MSSPAEKPTTAMAPHALTPKTPRPPDNPADIPPEPKRDVDWDLAKTDPASDYVERYVRATKRYGETTRCAAAKASGTSNGKSVVEVRNAEGAGCPAPGDRLLDVFYVDAAADRMDLDPSKRSAALGKWPDGSDPGAPPNAAIDVDAFTGPVKDALVAMKLTPVRAQIYGRGSYLVVTLAGWRDPITVNAPPESLRPTLGKLCDASRGLPMGFFAGIDRSTMLRVKCGREGGTARWDRL